MGVDEFGVKKLGTTLLLLDVSTTDHGLLANGFEWLQRTI